MACKYTASCIYNGTHFCRIHLLRTKGEEECPICLESLCRDRICLEICRHFFHRKCLVKTDTPCCPICKTSFSFTESFNLFGSECYANEVFVATIQHNREQRNLIIDTMDVLNTLASIDKSIPGFVNSIVLSLKHIFDIVPQPRLRYDIIYYAVQGLLRTVARLIQIYNF